MIFLFKIPADVASKHFRRAEVLYYKVLESVIEQERRRLGDTDLSVRKINNIVPLFKVGYAIRKSVVEHDKLLF